MEENIQGMYEKARAAFEEVMDWPQEKVDEMVAAVGWEWQKEETARDLAELAVEEGEIGVVEDKVDKIRGKVRGTMWDFRNVKTCGLIEEDKERGIKTFAKPIGVVANVVPCTNPEGTVCTVGLGLLKTRNAMIVSPHPRTQETSYKTVQYGRKALEKVGAPVDLFQSIRYSSHEKASELMRACEFSVATGGDALIRVVYEAATPCHTVGAGNVVSIVDETADIDDAVRKIVRSKTVNNSTSCSSDNAVAIEEIVYDEAMEALKAEGGYLCNTEEREKLRKALWPNGKRLNRDIIGKPATYIAEVAGIEVPEDTRFLMVMGEKAGPEDRFSGEKLSLVLTVWKWNDFDDMVEQVKKMHKFSGEGHSVNIHTEKWDRMEKLAKKANVGRVNVNMPNALVNTGSWHNGHPWTESIGCGTWVGNMTSENINWRHFLNTTRLSVPIEEHVPTDEEIFGHYLEQVKEL